ncbi:hypothetical protein KFU94_67030 [Chloroflexi bacterium TSY]|nr:hypothetical protein [Chloroflexi bacterium TSY]
MARGAIHRRAAALKLLTGKQRATVADRMRRHESKNLLAEVVMYCADRVANIERELTRVNSMIARGECVPLLESIARGGAICQHLPAQSGLSGGH